MFEKTRRELLRDLGLAVMAAASVDHAAAQHVHQMAADDSGVTGGVYKPKVFTTHEYATLERLTDLILPPEGNLPGARAAGAAAWIDMLAAVNDELAEIYTGGLARLDDSMRARNGEDFISAPPAEQTAYLDVIAYRKNKSDETAADIVFFDWARRMTVDAFYTSKIGVKALDYRGNTPQSKYQVPVEAMDYALKKSGFA